MNGENLWSLVLDDVREKISRASYETWFVATSAKELTENTLVIETHNIFQKDWLEDRYHSIVEEVLRQLTDKEMTVRFTCENAPPVESKKLSDVAISGYTELFQKVSDLEAKVEILENEIKELKKD